MFDNIVNRVLEHPAIIELRDTLAEILVIVRELRRELRSRQ